MEFIIEIIIEIFGELLIELIGAGISKFGVYVDTNQKAKKVFKYILSFCFFGLSIVLLTLSIIYKKQFLINISLIYMLVLVLLNLFKFINQNIWKKSKINNIIKWNKKIVYYSYPILLIVMTSLYLSNANAKAWIIALSVVAIIIYFIIDMFRLDKFITKRKIAKNKKIQEKIKIENGDLKEEDQFWENLNKNEI